MAPDVQPLDRQPALIEIDSFARHLGLRRQRAHAGGLPAGQGSAEPDFGPRHQAGYVALPADLDRPDSGQRIVERTAKLGGELFAARLEACREHVDARQRVAGHRAGRFDVQHDARLLPGTMAGGRQGKVARRHIDLRLHAPDRVALPDQLQLALAGQLATAEIDELSKLRGQMAQVECRAGGELVERAGGLDVHEARVAVHLVDHRPSRSVVGLKLDGQRLLPFQGHAVGDRFQVAGFELPVPAHVGRHAAGRRTARQRDVQIASRDLRAAADRQGLGQQGGQAHQVQFAAQLTGLPAGRSQQAAGGEILRSDRAGCRDPAEIAIHDQLVDAQLLGRAHDLAGNCQPGHFDPVVPQGRGAQQQVGGVDLALDRDFVLLGPAPPGAIEPGRQAAGQLAAGNAAPQERLGHVERQAVDLAFQVSAAQRAGGLASLAAERDRDVGGPVGVDQFGAACDAQRFGAGRIPGDVGRERVDLILAARDLVVDRRAAAGDFERHGHCRRGAVGSAFQQRREHIFQVAPLGPEHQSELGAVTSKCPRLLRSRSSCTSDLSLLSVSTLATTLPCVSRSVTWLAASGENQPTESEPISTVPSTGAKRSTSCPPSGVYETSVGPRATTTSSSNSGSQKSRRSRRRRGRAPAGWLGSAAASFRFLLVFCVSTVAMGEAGGWGLAARGDGVQSGQR